MVLPVTKWAKRTCGGLKSLLCVAAFSAEQSATNLKNMYFKKVSKPQNTRGGLVVVFLFLVIPFRLEEFEVVSEPRPDSADDVVCRLISSSELWFRMQTRFSFVHSSLFCLKHIEKHLM